MNRVLTPLVCGVLALGCGKKAAPEAEAPAPTAAVAPSAPVEPAPAVRRGPDDSPDPVPPPDDPPTEPAEAPAAVPSAPVTVEAPELKALAAAYTERACVLKREDRTGTEAIDKKYGFADAADFAQRFAAAAEANAAWAETTMATALWAKCLPEDPPGGPQ